MESDAVATNVTEEKNETKNDYIIAMQLQECIIMKEPTLAKNMKHVMIKDIHIFCHLIPIRSISTSAISAAISTAIFAVISASVPTTIFTVSTTDLLITNKCFHEIQNQKNNIQSDYDTYNNQNQKNNNQSDYNTYNTNFSQKPNRSGTLDKPKIVIPTIFYKVTEYEPKIDDVTKSQLQNVIPILSFILIYPNNPACKFILIEISGLNDTSDIKQDDKNFKRL
ncbi:hypothetical protein C2G38_2183816 [Gigaspora rosea]|uniref:Uncharacterized protein n=1 Tax=Gigaspora rosea TaxID=44941 RepID=A0A397V9V9_9GLOM|nr:hypothetical protein C2G38_2183816 [Gigaspora rosea]